MPRITLIGYRGTGKSTVAATLARLLECEWLDADAVLEEKLGCSIAMLVRDRGEPAFRAEESTVLGQLLSGFPGVLATGGGVVLAERNRQLLRACGRPIVWLTAPAEVIRARLAADPTTADRRPALSGNDPLAEVKAAIEDREPLYRECADVTFDTASLPAAEVARRIALWLKDFGPPATGERSPS